MILLKDLPKFNSTSEALNYINNLEKDKKYKLPYLEQHFLRRGTYLINDEVQEVLLSTWNFKPRKIDFKRMSVSIMEFPKSYVLMITKSVFGSVGDTKFYEGLDHIPTWKEIEEYIRSDF